MMEKLSRELNDGVCVFLRNNLDWTIFSFACRYRGYVHRAIFWWVRCAITT